MRKILLLVAVAAVWTACNKPAKTDAVQQDSIVIEEVVVSDTTNAAIVDSVANADTTAVAQ